MRFSLLFPLKKDYKMYFFEKDFWENFEGSLIYTIFLCTATNIQSGCKIIYIIFFM